jgi:hypothetical protein
MQHTGNTSYFQVQQQSYYSTVPGSDTFGWWVRRIGFRAC